MIFRDWNIWYIKMPQLNRKYPSGAAKRRKKEESIKADEKWKGLLDRFVVAGGSGEPKEENATSSTQVVNSSYVCLAVVYRNRSLLLSLHGFQQVGLHKFKLVVTLILNPNSCLLVFMYCPCHNCV